MSVDRIYVQDADLPLNEWVRVQARLACGCFVRSNVKTTKPATAEYVLNDYGAHIALSAHHLNDHIHACQQWLKEQGGTAWRYPEHHVDSLYAIDTSNYDGQGKSRRQEEIDSMWVIAYLVVAVGLVIVGVAVLWWWL